VFFPPYLYYITALRNPTYINPQGIIITEPGHSGMYLATLVLRFLYYITFLVPCAFM